MLKTLKGKITLVYIILVILNAIIGLAAASNFYRLGREIDTLIVSNYKSISAASNMIESIEEQNNAILNYIHVSKQESSDLFYKSNTSFDSWMSVEDDNITEIGERESSYKIKAYYEKYVKLFSELQEISGSQSEEALSKFYEENIMPEYLIIKYELRVLTHINEGAMFNSKNRLVSHTNSYLYINAVLSIIAVAGGYLLSWFLIKKFLKPMHLLTESIKSVKEGNLSSQAPVVFHDEVGELATEFNNMTKRLQEFEQSTMGKLLSEKNKSFAIVKSISDPLIVLDMDYNIILLNNAFENFFNITEVNALNKNFLDEVHDTELYNYISSVNTKPNEYEERLFYLLLNGKEYYFNVIVKLVKDRYAHMNGVVVLFQNVTQFKQLEKIKTDFISTVSHEFKTPLTSIMIGTSIISNPSIGVLNEKQHEILDTIIEDGERLSSLINNLLQLSKIQSNKSIFDIKPCSIEDIAIVSIKTLLEQAKAKDIKISCIMDKNLPKVNVDFEKTSWIFNNLISNAIKHTSPGGSVSITSSVDENKLFVYVRDTGSGIPKEYLEKIFDKFVQVSDYNSEENGTGLGLAITKEIVEAYDGEIWCESSPGLGSAFIFTLPLA